MKKLNSYLTKVVIFATLLLVTAGVLELFNFSPVAWGWIAGAGAFLWGIWWGAKLTISYIEKLLGQKVFDDDVILIGGEPIEKKYLKYFQQVKGEDGKIKLIVLNDLAKLTTIFDNPYSVLHRPDIYPMSTILEFEKEFSENGLYEQAQVLKNFRVKISRENEQLRNSAMAKSDAE